MQVSPGVFWVPEAPWVPGLATHQFGRLNDRADGDVFRPVDVFAAHLFPDLRGLAAHVAWQEGSVFVSWHAGAPTVIVPVDALTVPDVSEALFRALDGALLDAPVSSS